MNFSAVIMVVIVPFYCFASQRAESSTSSQSALLNPSDFVLQTDLIAEAHTLLESGEIASTLPLRKLIKGLKAEKKKGGSSESISEITQCLNSLRIKWAEVLLECAHKKVRPGVIDPDELIECIEQLWPAIGSSLLPIQQIWDIKESREKKWQAVEKTLIERQREIDNAKAEEKRWVARREEVHHEIERAPDNLPADLLHLKPRDIVKKIALSSSRHKAGALHAQDHLNKILALLEECRDITVTALKPLPENLMGYDNHNDDDDDYLYEQAEAVSSAAQEVGETYLTLSRRVVWDVKNQMREEEEVRTLEEIQSEYSQLLSELHDRADIAVHAVQQHRKLCARIQSNRKLYSDHRLIESESFNLQHARLQADHVKYVLLRARLKLLLPVAHRTRNELLVQHSEIILLENHKEDLLPDERDALSIVNPSVWMRIKNLFV